MSFQRRAPASVPRPALRGTSGDVTPIVDLQPPAQEPPRYLAGDVIVKKYRLTRLIAEGGMGAVWLARNLSLDVDVAVKLIRREIARPETAQRLLQEARAAARLRHPSIVRVFDFGESERGDPFIVMEVLSGESLRDLLDRKARLPAAAAVRTLLPIASALAAAHAQGIVHRDLKPENIVLTTDETGGVVPKVVDFGIAKLRREEVDGRLTAAGDVLGSPDYMSPEQARGRDEVDEATDVWALSVVLYETTTGKTPFTGPNYNALITAIVTDAPTPITDYAAGDADLWSIVARGLAKDKNVRWPSLRQLGAALARWCMARGYDTDVVGNSLTAHWLAQRASLVDIPDSQRAVTLDAAQAMDRVSLEPPLTRTSTPDRLASTLVPTGEVPASDRTTVAAPPSATGSEAPPIVAPLRKPRPVVAAGVAAVLLLTTVGFLVLRSGSGPAVAPSAGAPATASSPSPVPSPVQPTASAADSAPAAGSAPAPPSAEPSTSTDASAPDKPVRPGTKPGAHPSAHPSSKPAETKVPLIPDTPNF